MGQLTMFKVLFKFYILLIVILQMFVSVFGWFSGWFQWCPQPETMLRATEKKILSHLRTAYRGWFVDIGPVVGTSDKLWTISLNSDSTKTPLVLVHGLGAGVAFWCLNLDALASTRPVYAMDVLGFGRSSRPDFSKDALVAEKQFVRTIEEWRKEMKLDKMIILGHSMGGFIAASYALSYPERVKHLILADPWGFPDRPPEVHKKLPLWARAIAYSVQPLNPLWAIRFAGPFGQWVVEKMRSDIMRKFESFLPGETNIIAQYVHQCNSQKPSGESAFHAMMSGFGWAKNPMVHRIDQLHKDVPITLLYGSRSWIDHSAGKIMKEKRSDSYVRLQVIMGAGHHVYADKPDMFNRYVLDACSKTDSETSLNSTIAAAASENTESDFEQDDNTNKPWRVVIDS